MKNKFSFIKLTWAALMALSTLGFASCSRSLETRTQSISSDFDAIEIITDTADVILTSASDSECKVVTYEHKKTPYTPEVNDGKLTIRVNDRRSWFEKIFTPKMTLTLYLPETKYGVLLIACDTGNLTIGSHFGFDSVNLSTDTGNIDVKDVDCNALALEVSTGNVSLTHVSSMGKIGINSDTGYVKINGSAAEEISTVSDTGGTEITSCNASKISIASDTGRIGFDDVSCSLLGIKSRTGNINLKNVIAEESFDIQSSTGNVELENCDASSVFVKTSTGDVTGNFLTDKIIFADTSTGKVDIPKLTSGGRCEITTSTGDIKITVN